MQITQLESFRQIYYIKFVMPRSDELPGYKHDSFDTAVEFVIRYWKVPHRFVFGLLIGEFMNMKLFKESMFK